MDIFLELHVMSKLKYKMEQNLNINRPSGRVREKMKIVRFNFGGELCGTKS